MMPPKNLPSKILHGSSVKSLSLLLSVLSELLSDSLRVTERSRIAKCAAYNYVLKSQHPGYLRRHITIVWLPTGTGSRWGRSAVHIVCPVYFLYFWLSCRFVLYYCNTVGWTWWDWNLILEHLPSVLWYCWLGHLIRKNLSPLWPIMCSVGRETLLYFYSAMWVSIAKKVVKVTGQRSRLWQGEMHFSCRGILINLQPSVQSRIN